MLFSAVNVKTPLFLVLPQAVDISESCSVNNEMQVLHSLHVESGHRKFKLVTLYRPKSADFSPKIRKVEEAFKSQWVFFSEGFPDCCVIIKYVETTNRKSVSFFDYSGKQRQCHRKSIDHVFTQGSFKNIERKNTW